MKFSYEILLDDNTTIIYTSYMKLHQLSDYLVKNPYLETDNNTRYYTKGRIKKLTLISKIKK